MKTNEGANAYEHSLDHALEFFSKAGSLYDTPSKGKSFYQNESSALKLFINSWIVDKPLSFALLLWLRDCRGGAGNRSGSRAIYNWLAKNNPEWVKANLHQLPMVGRWDDLRSLFGTTLEVDAAKFWAIALSNEDVRILAAKWANRSDHPLRRALNNISVPQLRKLLASIRQNHIVEHKMCQKLWESIQYKTVPSVAMARYTKAFKKHDDERFQAFKNKVKTGEEKVHAEVLFPHDCIRTAISGDPEMAELQFDALPNYLEGEDRDERIMVLSDTSGSMDTIVGGSIRAVDVSTSLALYCSSRMREDSPFYKRFIGFCSEGTFKDWRNLSFAEALKSKRVFDRAVGSTRIDKAMDLILNTAVKREISQDLMPTTLLIVSDMQFHRGGSNNDDTEIEACLRKWNEAGYESPKVVYWNTAGYDGSQATEGMKNVGMISGFSPSILKSVLGGTDFSPIAIMLRTLEKYEVELPEEIE